MDLGKYTFLSGVELDDGTIIVASQNKEFDVSEDPHTLFLFRAPDGTWTQPAHLPWASAGVSSNADSTGIASMSPAGKFVELRQDGHDNYNAFEEQQMKTVFRFSKAVDNVLYSGGTNRHLFRARNKTWTDISTDVMREGKGSKSFDGLTGFDENELYAFGWRGIIWSNYGGAWHQIESPTNLILSDGDVHDGTVFIGGQIGTILSGRGETWEVTENPVLPQDIWSVRAFKDAVYFSCMSGILRLKDGELELVKQLGPDMRTAMSLFVGPSGLWSVGASDIVLFDGDEWHTIAQSD